MFSEKDQENTNHFELRAKNWVKLKYRSTLERKQNSKLDRLSEARTRM